MPPLTVMMSQLGARVCCLLRVVAAVAAADATSEPPAHAFADNLLAISGCFLVLP